jgi:hypothetical protein
VYQINKSLQSVLLILLPFYPLVGFAFHFITSLPLDLATNFFLLPVASYFLFQGKVKLPPYLILFIIFTLYHLVSLFANDARPGGENAVYSILADTNLLGCSFLIIIESMNFEESFMVRMNKNILIVVVLALIVSIIQLQFPTFMFNEQLLVGDDLDFWGEEMRNTAFYSYINTNSLGVCFPIFIAILLNYFNTKKKHFAIIILSGIIVSFLTKSRYVMISTVIAFAQLFFAKKKSFSSRISLVLTFGLSIGLIIFVANQVGFNINEIISNRIMEKGSDMESAKARVTSYEVFLIKFPEHSLFGVGPKTRPDVVELLNGEAPVIHVGYLCYLYYYGIIGCLFIFISFYYLMKNAWSVGKKYNFWGSFYGLLGFFIANITMVYFNMAETGIVIAILYLKFYNQSSELEYKNIDSSNELIEEESTL